MTRRRAAYLSRITAFIALTCIVVALVLLIEAICSLFGLRWLTLAQSGWAVLITAVTFCIFGALTVGLVNRYKL